MTNNAEAALGGCLIGLAVAGAVLMVAWLASRIQSAKARAARPVARRTWSTRYWNGITLELDDSSESGRLAMVDCAMKKAARTDLPRTRH